LPAADFSMPAWPGETVLVDGISLHLRRTPGANGAEPALYVHGLGGSSTNWTDLAAVLAGYLDGEAVDLPGFGWSDPAPRGNYSLATHAHSVGRLVEQRGRGPVPLFGNSMGGAVAILLAARRPDLVRTLTLVSPAVPDLRPRTGSDRLMPLLLMPGASRLVERRLATMDPAERVRQVLDLCYGDPSLVPPGRLAEAAADARRRGGPPGGPPAVTRPPRRPGAGYPPRAPSLGRGGARPPPPPPGGAGPVAPRPAEAIRGAGLLVLPGVAHVAQMEAPVSVARAFLALREDARGTAAPATDAAPAGDRADDVPGAVRPGAPGQGAYGK